MSNSSRSGVEKDAASALIVAGVGLLTLIVPSWGDLSPLLAMGLLLPLRGVRPLIPLVAAPLVVTGVPAAGLGVVAALLLTDDLSPPVRWLAVGVALLAGAAGTVAAGLLPDLTLARLMAGVAAGVVVTLTALFFPGRLSLLVGGVSATMVASLVWGWAPMPFPGWERVAEGLFVAGGLGMGAHVMGKLDRIGVAAGALVGGIIFTVGWWGGFLMMTLFVIMGVGFTRSARDETERHEIRRAPHVIANIGPATLCIVMAGLVEPSLLWMIAFAGALAAATADTLSAELGRRWGDGPVDLFSRTPVAPGTDGGVSWAGTLFGGVGALVIGAAGWGLGYYPPLGLVVVTAGGMAGSLADSAIGSLYERDGLIGNHRVNFTGAATGGVVALALGLGL